MKIVRIFPRRTLATPDDRDVRIGFPDLFPPAADEYWISVTFTYDIPVAERMFAEWKRIGPTRIGGPAFGDPGGDFVPGRFLKPGYVITSRGCPNSCYFCYVPKREGKVRHIPITDGWRVQDNNLLACSREHIDAVFSMLAKYPRRAIFQGGLEAARMKPWIAKRLFAIKPDRIYFAYDRPRDREPLAAAVQMCVDAGFTLSHHTISAYALIGYPGDSFDAATERMNYILSLGIIPFAMLFRDDAGAYDPKWRAFQREWCHPIIVGSKLGMLNQERAGVVTVTPGMIRSIRAAKRGAKCCS